eukprot:Awhi_evm1s4005
MPLQRKKSQPEVLSNVYGPENIAKKYHKTCPSERTFNWMRQPKTYGSSVKGRPPCPVR